METTIDIIYGTGNVAYEKVRTGVLQNKERLTAMGYNCSWNSDLNLSEELNSSRLRDKGYMLDDNCITTRFEKSGLPFTITIFPRSKKAKVSGENSIDSSEYLQTIDDFRELEGLTKINLHLRQPSLDELIH